MFVYGAGEVLLALCVMLGFLWIVFDVYIKPAIQWLKGKIKAATGKGE